VALLSLLGAQTLLFLSPSLILEDSQKQSLPETALKSPDKKVAVMEGVGHSLVATLLPQGYNHLALSQAVGISMVVASLRAVTAGSPGTHSFLTLMGEYPLGRARATLTLLTEAARGQTSEILQDLLEALTPTNIPSPALSLSAI